METDLLKEWLIHLEGFDDVVAFWRHTYMRTSVGDFFSSDQPLVQVADQAVHRLATSSDRQAVQCCQPFVQCLQDVDEDGRLQVRNETEMVLRN